MIQSASFTDMRSYVVNKFNTLRVQAVRDSLVTRLLRKKNGLRNFDDDRAIRLQTRRFVGLQNVRVDQIVGTLARDIDFDRNFRPLSKHLRERWVNAFLQLDTEGWQPIVLHKLDDLYYVEDGHHRVSVAHFVGMQFIEATVWDHTFCPPPPNSPGPKRAAFRVKMEVCCAS